MLCSAMLWKNYLHCLPSDPNIRKEWMNFIFNEVSDCISKNLVLCSLHFTDSFTNKAQFDVGFSERLKLKDDAVPIILNPTVMSLCLLNRSFDEYLCIFNINHCSVHLWHTPCPNYTWHNKIPATSNLAVHTWGLIYKACVPTDCHGAHTREEQEHGDEDVNSNNNI